MFLRPNHRGKDGKPHTYWSLVESVRTPDGPGQRTLCHLGEWNGSDHARWLKTVEVFNEQGEAQPLKLFPSPVEPPADDPQVARVLVNRVRLERTRRFGDCYLGLELWRRLERDRFFEQVVDDDSADVPWSRVAALLAINRRCAPGSELALEQRWFPSTALDDLLRVEEAKINDTRLYRCLDRILPHKTKLERHLGRQPCRCLDEGDDSAHGGASVRQGPTDLGLRSGHRKRGKPGSDSQTGRTVSGGHATQPDEALGSRTRKRRLDAGPA